MCTKNGGEKRFLAKSGRWVCECLLGQKFCRNHSLFVSEINLFLHFKQNFKMAINKGRKMIFGKKWQMTAYTLGVKNFVWINLLHRFLDKCVLAFLHRNLRTLLNGRKTVFVKKCQVTVYSLWVKKSIKIALSHTVSEIKVFLCLSRKFKTATKNGGEIFFFFFFLQNLADDCAYPWDKKFCQNRCVLHHFRDKCVLHRNSRSQPKMAEKRFLA